MKLLHGDKRNAFVFLLYFVTLSLVIQSCTFNPYNYTYIQTPVNVTDLQKKGDLRVDGYVWTNHADAQASYAISNRLGVMAGYNQGFKNSIQYGEVGAGYFSPAERKIRFAVFAGVGLGSVSVDYKDTRSSRYEEYYFDLSSQYKKLFIQPSISYQLSPKILLTGTFRLSYINFQSYSYLFEDYSIDSSGNKTADTGNWSYHYEINNPQSTWILDPSSTITVNVLKNMSFIGTINYSIPLMWARDDFKGNNQFISAYSRPRQQYSGVYNEQFNHPVYSNLAVHIGLRFRINTSKLFEGKE